MIFFKKIFFSLYIPFTFICVTLVYFYSSTKSYRFFMSKEIAPEIRENYLFYNALLKERKSIFQEVIEISEVGNNANFLETSKEVKHVSLSKQIIFIVTVKCNNYKHFQFKLRCKDLSQRPFFRYDSDGGAHRNYDENIPFTYQQITTPHFNYYNKNGLNIAYKTDQLKNEKERKALEDINFCIAHYCNEANIRLKENDFPEISILPSTLKLEVVQEDPNSNVKFI